MKGFRAAFVIVLGALALVDYSTAKYFAAGALSYGILLGVLALAVMVFRSAARSQIVRRRIAWTAAASPVLAIGIAALVFWRPGAVELPSLDVVNPPGLTQATVGAPFSREVMVSLLPREDRPVDEVARESSFASGSASGLEAWAAVHHQDDASSIRVVASYVAGQTLAEMNWEMVAVSREFLTLSSRALPSPDTLEVTRPLPGVAVPVSNSSAEVELIRASDGWVLVNGEAPGSIRVPTGSATLRMTLTWTAPSSFRDSTAVRPPPADSVADLLFLRDPLYANKRGFATWELIASPLRADSLGRVHVQLSDASRLTGNLCEDRCPVTTVEVRGLPRNSFYEASGWKLDSPATQAYGDGEITRWSTDDVSTPIRFTYIPGGVRHVPFIRAVLWVSSFPDFLWVTFGFLVALGAVGAAATPIYKEFVTRRGNSKTPAAA